MPHEPERSARRLVGSFSGHAAVFFRSAETGGIPAPPDPARNEATIAAFPCDVVGRYFLPRATHPGWSDRLANRLLDRRRRDRRSACLQEEDAKDSKASPRPLQKENLGLSRAI